MVARIVPGKNQIRAKWTLMSSPNVLLLPENILSCNKTSADVTWFF